MSDGARRLHFDDSSNYRGLEKARREMLRLDSFLAQLQAALATAKSTAEPVTFTFEGFSRVDGSCTVSVTVDADVDPALVERAYCRLFHYLGQRSLGLEDFVQNYPPDIQAALDAAIAEFKKEHETIIFDFLRQISEDVVKKRAAQKEQAA